MDLFSFHSITVITNENSAINISKAGNDTDLLNLVTLSQEPDIKITKIS